MAAMDSSKLATMCSAINGKAGEYDSTVTAGSKSLVESFNSNWVSNASKTLAGEIKEVVDKLADSIFNTFSSMNDAISTSVTNFNNVEDESINYPGFSFSKPNFDATLANTLPNGKVGVADGADVNTVANPINNMTQSINSVLGEIVSTVKSADAFDGAEQEVLTSAVSNAQSKFNEAMGELTSSLSTRLEGEQSTRQELNTTNI